MNPSSTTLAPNRILVVEDDSEHVRWLRRTARAVGAWAEARPRLGTDEDILDFDLIAVNYDGLSKRERDHLLNLFPRELPAPRLLLFSEGRNHKSFVDFLERRALTNLLAKNGRVDGDELIVTLRKILRGDIFGLEKYFVWGVETASLRVSSSEEKQSVFREAQAYVKEFEIHPRLEAGFLGVVEEFITNALYNAPRDGEGDAKYAHLSRSEPVTLDSPQEVEISFACDGRRLGVAIADSFGSLESDVLLDYLSRCFRQDPDQVVRTGGGAGLGFYFAFDALSHLTVNLARGKRTELIGLIDLTGGYKDFVRKSKSFNVFVDASYGSELELDD